ncbi:LuxR C-terminal-related transcriptional regulator [Dyadobacter endophyticus]|uniref:LuxR C-terminal-related transcriptional regulator n=1 Tax=Dyadobacter endophyticus TaxID=1749036 RepID=UPI003CF5A813
MSTLQYFDQDNKHVKHLRRDSSETDETDSLLEQPFIHRNFFGVLSQFPCVNWVVDVRTQTYTFISNNTHEHFGFPIDSYISIGPKFQDSIKHPEDRTHSRSLLRQVWHVLGDIPPLSRSNFKFSHDYRIVKPDGKIIRILEQNSVFQQDPAGNITHLLGVCNDITEWKKTGSQLASLSSIIDKQCFLFVADPVKSDAILSRRELEILKLISEGHSSKFIADKLFISFHTVNTHRQKMIEKTKTRNASGLVQFAICNGLI